MNTDIVVYDRLGQIGLMVEVNAERGSTPEWAQEYCTNLLHGFGEYRPPYFMIVTRDHTYIWNRKEIATMPVSFPGLTLDTGNEMAELFRRTHLDAATISGAGLEDIVILWLEEMVAEASRSERSTNSLRHINAPDLTNVLMNARIEREMQLEPVR